MEKRVGRRDEDGDADREEAEFPYRRRHFQRVRPACRAFRSTGTGQTRAAVGLRASNRQDYDSREQGENEVDKPKPPDALPSG